MAGSVAKVLGKAATPFVEGVLNSGLGAVGGVVESLASGTGISGGDIFADAVGGGFGGTVGGAFPTKGLTTLAQAEHFVPRTAIGFLNPGKNAQALMKGTALGEVTGDAIGEFGEWIDDTLFSTTPTPNYQDYWPDDGWA